MVEGKTCLFVQEEAKRKEPGAAHQGLAKDSNPCCPDRALRTPIVGCLLLRLAGRQGEGGVEIICVLRTFVQREEEDQLRGKGFVRGDGKKVTALDQQAQDFYEGMACVRRG